MRNIVIAARGGPTAKTRFASHLDVRERDRLTAAMLEAMLVRLRDDRLRVWVVSPTPILLALARACHVETIAQSSGSLNTAFELALLGIAETGSSGDVGLLPGDLPMIDVRELHLLFDAMQSHDIAMARALSDGGTGALVVKQSRMFPLRFGAHSFHAHIAAARVLGLKVAVVDAPSLGADIDAPEDLRALLPEVAASSLPASLKQCFAELGHAAVRREVA